MNLHLSYKCQSCIKLQSIINVLILYVKIFCITENKNLLFTFSYGSCVLLPCWGVLLEPLKCLLASSFTNRCKSNRARESNKEKGVLLKSQAAKKRIEFVKLKKLQKLLNKKQKKAQTFDNKYLRTREIELPF